MRKNVKIKLNNTTRNLGIITIPLRYIIAVLIAIIETAGVIGIVIYLCSISPMLYLGAVAVQIFCTIQIISSDDNPDYKLPWLLLVLAIPVVGFMLYFLFYSRKLSRRCIRRMDAVADLGYQKDATVSKILKDEDPRAFQQAQMLTTISNSQIFANTQQIYLPLGEDLHRMMLKDLKQAEKFIYMEYFIIETGIFWDSVFDILQEKAAAGVEVKLLYDDIGCMALLPGNYFRTLRRFGIEAAPFSILTGSAYGKFNNRSHRKITIIDGKIGYTGGINIADEYINAVTPYGHWKDTGIRLEGNAVWEMTRLFLADYGMNVWEIPLLPQDAYPETNIPSDGYVVPFGDGPRPIYRRPVAKTLIQDMLSGARDYVYITTPYLIIDNDLCCSLENTALRGVDVRLILPGVPDKKLVYMMSRTYYHRLMSAGVTILEYSPGFLHAKSILCDDATAMIGTVNLDYRSLVHHFENGVWLHRSSCIQQLKDDILQTMEKCRTVTEYTIKTTLTQKILCSIVRIFAPML